MSLRTRRLLVLPATLMFLVVACTGGTPTQAPATGTAAPTATGSAPTDAPPSDGPTDAPPSDGPTDAPPSDGPTDAPPSESAPPAGDQIFRLYLGATDPPTLDPNAAEDSQSISVLTALHRGLMYFTPDLGTTPALAESVTNNEEFTEFTFTLKEGITYSDGQPITSQDFMYSWQRLVTPSLANPYGYLLCIVEGVADFLPSCGNADASNDDADVANMGISAPDDSTFVVTLSTPATFFLSIASMWPVVPLNQAWVEGAPFGEAAGYISSGPYMLTDWQHSSLMTLEPNPAWTGDQQATVTVEMNIGGDPDAAFVNFEQGLLDTVVVPGTQLRRVLDDPTYTENYRLEQLAQLAITYYGFATCIQPADACPANDVTGQSPTANQNFRIALTHAINKQQFIDLTFGGTGQIANSFVMPGLLGYQGDDYVGPYPFDPALAAAAMTTALTELGVEDTNADTEITAADVGTLTFGYNSDAGHLPRVVNLAEQWRTNLGFTEDQFQLIGTDFATFLQQRQAGEYAISRNGWGADFPHPANQLEGLFTCGGTNNDEQWCDETFDAALAEGAATADQAQQDTIYRDAEQIMLNAAAMLPLRFGNVTYLIQPWVEGLTPTSSDHQNIGDSFYETVTIAAH